MRPTGAERSAKHNDTRSWKQAVYVGTYTTAGSRGIYRVEFDPVSGALTPPVLAAEAENPSFLCLHPGGRVLYAVNEVSTFDLGNSGAVSAFTIDGSTGDLSLLNQQSSLGADPCHLAVDGAGRHVIAANYNGGNVVVLPLANDGGLRPASDVRHHAGSGPHAKRQRASHPHAVLFDRTQQLAFVADLGADRIFRYAFTASTGRLVPHNPPFISLAPGAGPRHLAWHPSGETLYALNELHSSVTVFGYDDRAGVLSPLQTIGMLPDGFAGDNTGAEIEVDPNGRFLYASNRGHDSVAVFAVGDTGTLHAVSHVVTGGRTPRHFAVDPSGHWVLVAHQDSDSIAVFRIEPETGLLHPHDATIPVPRPVCLLFAQHADERPR